VKDISKEIIRKQSILTRDKMEKKVLIYKSQFIIEKLKNLECIKNALNIMCYVSFGSEVETHNLISMWISSGKKISVPYIEQSHEKVRRMLAVSISGLSELSPGTYGILEPKLEEKNVVLPEKFDVIIVPGTAFDENKNRMGYGAGYYDRFLQETSTACSKIGICYDFQVLEKIPVDEFDVPLDMLITDKRVIY
jgi:5-formyltetrahydrofolate cyclo-ligase